MLARITIPCWLTLLTLLAQGGALRAQSATLTIREAVERALASGDVEARLAQVDEARARQRAGLLWSDPSVTVDRQDIFDRGVAPGFVQDLVKVEQELPGSRRLRARRLAGAAEVRRAMAQVDLTRRQRELDVRRAFVKALVAQQEVAAYEPVVARIRGLQEVVTARVKAGESSHYESARIALAEAQERDAQSGARAELARQRAALAAAMASPLAPGTRLVGTLTERAPSAEVLARFVQGVRPELTAARAFEEVARAGERAAHADTAPRFTVGSGIMRFAQDGLPEQGGFNAVASVALPLSGRRSAETDAARARSTAARLDLAASERRIAAEVAGARETVEIASVRLTELEAAAEGKLTPLLEMARTSYQAGLQSLLELLDAYRLEREFALQRLRARGALAEALEELALALGVENVPGR